eukprot:3579809-Pyramimonas_sp.AAC.1
MATRNTILQCGRYCWHAHLDPKAGSARARRGGRMPQGGSVVQGAAEGRCLIEKPRDYKHVSGVGL